MDGGREMTGYVFLFQAEDGIRDWSVTGVQTCALPIYLSQNMALLPLIRPPLNLIGSWLFSFSKKMSRRLIPLDPRAIHLTDQRQDLSITSSVASVMKDVIMM